MFFYNLFKEDLFTLSSIFKNFISKQTINLLTPMTFFYSINLSECLNFLKTAPCLNTIFITPFFLILNINSYWLKLHHQLYLCSSPFHLRFLVDQDLHSHSSSRPCFLHWISKDNIHKNNISFMVNPLLHEKFKEPELQVFY